MTFEEYVEKYKASLTPDELRHYEAACEHYKELARREQARLDEEDYS